MAQQEVQPWTDAPLFTLVGYDQDGHPPVSYLYDAVRDYVNNAQSLCQQVFEARATALHLQLGQANDGNVQIAINDLTAQFAQHQASLQEQSNGFLTGITSLIKSYFDRKRMIEEAPKLFALVDLAIKKRQDQSQVDFLKEATAPIRAQAIATTLLGTINMGITGIDIDTWDSSIQQPGDLSTSVPSQTILIAQDPINSTALSRILADALPTHELLTTTHNKRDLVKWLQRVHSLRQGGVVGQLAGAINSRLLQGISAELRKRGVKMTPQTLQGATDQALLDAIVYSTITLTTNDATATLKQIPVRTLHLASSTWEQKIGLSISDIGNKTDPSSRDIKDHLLHAANNPIVENKQVLKDAVKNTSMSPETFLTLMVAEIDGQDNLQSLTSDVPQHPSAQVQCTSCATKTKNQGSP